VRDPEKWTPVFGQDHAQKNELTQRQRPNAGKISSRVDGKYTLAARIVAQRGLGQGAATVA
jgi:hypothetical protein